MSIALATSLETSFDDAVARTREALAAMNPQLLVDVTEEPSLRPIAEEVGSRLQAAISALSQ